MVCVPTMTKKCPKAGVLRRRYSAAVPLLKPIVFLFGDSPFRISFFETVFYLIGGFMGVFAMNASNSSNEGECVVVPMNVQA